MQIHDDHIEFETGGVIRRLHHVWLRDNCGCPDCRVPQTAERRLFTASIPDDIAPRGIKVSADGDLAIEWSDGHSSVFSAEWLNRFDYSSVAPTPDHAELWDSTFTVPRFDHDEMFSDSVVEIAYLDALRIFGAAVVSNVPALAGEVERFATRLGHVREVAFERVHNVYHDPEGYNVAHTPIELKPHTDMPSYHWPPSIQLLHFLRNRAVGGETVLVDGWHAVETLRQEDPEAFSTLTRIPVSFQLFSDDEDTAATAPMIQLDPFGDISTFRFSNQLALPVRARFEDVGEFYRAYRKLGRIIDSAESKVVFKAADGDLVTVHGHRVLHGRLPFEPGTGERHLQDVYMEYDDLMARRRVLLGIHKPLSPTPEAKT